MRRWKKWLWFVIPLSPAVILLAWIATDPILWSPPKIDTVNVQSIEAMPNDPSYPTTSREFLIMINGRNDGRSTTSVYTTKPDFDGWINTIPGRSDFKGTVSMKVDMAAAPSPLRFQIPLSYNETPPSRLSRFAKKMLDAIFPPNLSTSNPIKIRIWGFLNYWSGERTLRRLKCPTIEINVAKELSPASERKPISFKIVTEESYP